MLESILNKLSEVSDRFYEIEGLLSKPDIINDQENYIALSKEYSDLTPVVKSYQKLLEVQATIEETSKSTEDKDTEIRELAASELKDLKGEADDLELQLKGLLLPKDPDDSKNVFLEIRAGTGGDEAALFAGDLFRMYSRLAERNNWTTNVISLREGDHGGYKELVAGIQGKEVYKQLKFEAGVHRVQRVPETESQGRVHTSACSVAVLPEMESLGEIEIDKNDLRIDTFRASGAGGQHVNKTDSAVRLTHLPTGIVVECQDGRSQHKNKARAMSILRSRLLESEQRKQQEAEAENRRNLVGSGDRSERIRTYNFPQGRVTDHRINLTLYKLDEILSGDLLQVVEPLGTEHQADLLAAMASE